MWIYDNTERLINVYTRKHNQVKINELKKYPWINQKISSSNNVQKKQEVFAKDNSAVKQKEQENKKG
ncbi:hypothetical protein LPAF129_12320 [Ligilactobacillus pabuli]|uniref:Uncharacterized protein n=1 Tax=Ligilactobacillus pabuli TaxID=2886039 RepID=A0ABQ5JHI7_9LACO|nr:hypothetical protein [Ligilactobacillus pabuli]GKS81546.1 hypothetical protein LPAF129_12320 [Ligilactobacillus pabuli]